MSNAWLYCHIIDLLQEWFTSIFKRFGLFTFLGVTHHGLLLLKVQEAKILWAQDQEEMAVNLLKYVINHYNTEAGLGSVYCLTGKWLADTRSDSARIILTQYLQKAVQLLESAEYKNRIENVEKRSRAFYRMAHYSDSLYKSYEERLNSNEWQAALRLRTHKSKEAELLARRIKAEKWDSTKKGSQGSAVARLQDARVDLARKLIELQKQLAMDNEEAHRLESDKETFMRIALNSYRQCLITSNKYDLRVVFRITSLWFNLSTNEGVVRSMLDTINQVKSYKFLPLVYQIASRLGPLKESQEVLSFQYALTCLVRKLVIDHPYHTVIQLLALANGDRVKDKQKNRTAFVIDMEKKLAAEAVLNALASEKKSLINQMRQLVEVYIKLAEIEVRKEDMNKRLSLPRDIRSVRQLELVPVITAEIPISPDAQYPEGHFPYFKGLSDRFLVMHGVNAPKVVECFGSDGRQYRQLAKSGDDDLRQDAVMEQLFSLVNMLLQHHPDTCRRRLCIRTYKVVPFTPSAGVLEWVNGTMPLGEYLLGSDRKGGSHARYRPEDWTFPACREHLEKEEDKHNAFQTICLNFSPVFHNFFLEKFAHSAAWFERRLAYTRSVAASSMVGYVVGLGDRHAMNILLDQESAEVVHIDLGVAFEQGKMLKMPERVPFRLTRDIVDGMGVTGVEGVFRRCCEKTLLVMRTNKDALLTIIEVFLHDPLYKWALSPLKALQRQQLSMIDELNIIRAQVKEMKEEGEKKTSWVEALFKTQKKVEEAEKWIEVVKKGKSKDIPTTTTPDIINKTLEKEQRRRVRALHVRVTGLKDSNKVDQEVKSLMSMMGVEKPLHTGAWRVGRKNEGNGESSKERALILRFPSMEEKKGFLKKRPTLKKTGIFLGDDLTPSQLAHMREVMPEITAAREKGKLAFYRDGRVVILERRST
ncbi:hypothetical protein L7F22_017767 [Adiantum nelumboides]|nr:hypothetical protein [Adiantum nelumboides]